MTDTIHVETTEPIARIVPELYGHFVEHLGRCVYGGLWADDDPVGTGNGVRTDTLDLLRDLNPPIVRWPGGCFADDYHWEDGIGPLEQRPRRRSLWWTQGREDLPEEPNAFGTEEFLRVCRELDAEPYLAANVGSGSPDETTGWVEYCNYDGDTAYANRRRENGHDEPHGVAYWGIGNENWECGGRYDAESYALAYRQHANYVRAFERVMSADSLELVACGDADPEWNREFLTTLGESRSIADVGGYELLDHLSVHRYYHAGEGTAFSDEEYFRLFARAQQVADDVDRTAAILDEFVPPESVRIALDEWGVWHPEAVPANGLEQAHTVRDALSAAGVLDLLNVRADVVSMATIAQAVNVLQCLVQTDETTAWATPTYRVFDLYRPHMGADALSATVETTHRTVTGEDHDVALMSASASADDNELFCTLSNRALDSRSVEIDLDGAVAISAEATVVFADCDPDEHSTRENTETFAPVSHPVDTDGGRVSVDAPASSVLGVSVATDGAK